MSFIKSISSGQSLLVNTGNNKPETVTESQAVGVRLTRRVEMGSGVTRHIATTTTAIGVGEMRSHRGTVTVACRVYLPGCQWKIVRYKVVQDGMSQYVR